MGRHEEAIAEAKYAQKLDPLSLVVNLSMGARFYFARQYEQAILQLQKTLELEPNFIRGHAWLWQVYDQAGIPEKALKEFHTELSLSGAPKERLSALRATYAKSGAMGVRRQRLLWFQEEAKRRSVSPVIFAQKYALLGETEQAITWLQRAYEERSSGLVWLQSDPTLDSLHSDPRFQSLPAADELSGVGPLSRPLPLSRPELVQPEAAVPCYSVLRHQPAYCDLRCGSGYEFPLIGGAAMLASSH